MFPSVVLMASSQICNVKRFDFGWARISQRPLKSFIMASLNEIAPTSQNGATVSEQTTRAARKKTSMKLWSIVTKARNKFSAQLVKDCATKRKCIESYLANHPDPEKFWADYMEQANRLLDSKRFEKDCRNLGFSTEVVATHVVFLGNTAVNNTLKKGVEAVIGNKLSLYNERFLPVTAEKYSVEYIKQLPAPEVTEQ